MNNETPKQAARRLSQPKIDEGFKPEGLYPYTDHDGNITHYRIRLKNPVTREKWIRPLMFDGKEFVMKEPAFPHGKPLYHLQRLIDDKESNVFIVEGEPCVEVLAKLGILATTSGSCSSANAADWSVLAGREIIIWPDNDEHGKKYADEVKNILQPLGCKVSLIDISLLNLPIKGDAVDWISKNPSATKEVVQKLKMITPNTDSSAEDAEEESDNKKSQASALVDYVNERAALFHDKNKDVYAQDRQTNETRRIDSRAFKDWLVSNFYQKKGTSPRDQSVREAISTLSGLARQNGQCREVFIRVAIHDGEYYIDMAEPGQSRAIKINCYRWEIMDQPPVLFLRPESMQPLPEPSRQGDIELLWIFTNIPRESQLLVLAWILDSWRPDTPFAVFEIIGEQGSAKSTTQDVLRWIIDPNSCNLRAAPKTREDIYVCAGVNWLVSYENISHLSQDMQDAFCTLSTGAGFSKRKLYTDADESVIVVKRPTVLNGIIVAITAQDLIDRTVTVELPCVEDRRETPQLWKQFKEMYSSILGGLLDLFVMSLHNLPNIHIPKRDRPRLTEFARLGMAVAQSLALPPEAFLEQFNHSRSEAISRTIDANPVASAIVEYMESNPHGRIDTLKNLMSDIPKPTNSEAWPKTPKGFGDALRRAVPALRQLGIECRSLGKLGGNIRWEIKYWEQEAFSCPESPACPDGVLTRTLGHLGLALDDNSLSKDCT